MSKDVSPKQPQSLPVAKVLLAYSTIAAAIMLVAITMTIARTDRLGADAFNPEQGPAMALYAAAVFAGVTAVAAIRANRKV